MVRTAASPQGSALRPEPPADLEGMQAAESDPLLCSSPEPGISHHCTGQFLMMLLSGSQNFGFGALESLSGV